MSILETILIFGVIPAGIYALFAVMVFLPSLLRRPRYRPGHRWQRDPVWYVPHPQAQPAVAPPARPALAPAPALAALTQRGVSAEKGLADAGQVARGGASGSW